MMNAVKRLKEKEKIFDDMAAKFLFRHPYIGILLIFIVIPILVLLAVAFFTTIIVVPISFFMGWL